MANDHIVKSFDEDLGLLQDTIVEMGGLAEAELSGALVALDSRDGEGAASAASEDEKINAKERAIDELAIRIIALRQPMAEDLRVIIAGLRIANDLERVGDYAKNMANHIFTLSSQAPTGLEARVLSMGAVVQGMLTDAMDAFAHRDADKAEAVRDRDQEVDAQHTELFRDLLTRNAQDPRMATACTHLTFVARSLERIGDHVTNIAEDTLFIVTGEIPPDDRPKADEAAFVTVQPE